MWFGERDDEGLRIVHDAYVLFEDTNCAEPGQEHIARAWVLFGDLLPAKVRAGARFRFLEPPREADEATVLDVLIDDAQEPLKDPGPAKARTLRRA